MTTLSTYTCQHCGTKCRYPKDKPPSMCPMCMGDMEREETDDEPQDR